MCTLPLLAGENISARFVVPTVASSVDLVVHLGTGPDGVRRVEQRHYALPCVGGRERRTTGVAATSRSSTAVA
jgi:hypothetical protein